MSLCEIYSVKLLKFPSPSVNSILYSYIPKTKKWNQNDILMQPVSPAAIDTDHLPLEKQPLYTSSRHQLRNAHMHCSDPIKPIPSS